jgi:hypothetical protein
VESKGLSQPYCCIIVDKNVKNDKVFSGKARCPLYKVMCNRDFSSHQKVFKNTDDIVILDKNISYLAELLITMNLNIANT